MGSSIKTKTTGRPRRFIAMLVAAIIWAGFLGTAWFVWPHANASLLATKIKTATGDDLDETLQELARIGPVGIDKLVTLLGARRGDVRDAAFRVAMSEIERQCRTGYTCAGAVLDRMAASLAYGASHFDREQLRLASLIADRLLAAKHLADSVDRLRDCQIVIAADIRRRMSEPSPTEGRVGVVSFSAPIEYSAALQLKQGPSSDLSLPPIPPPAPQLDSMTSLPNRLDNALTTKAKPIEQRDAGPAVDAANDGLANQLSVDAQDSDDPAQGDAETVDAENEPVSPPNLRRDRKVNETSTHISVEAHRDVKPESAPPNRAATLRPADLSRLLDLDARLRSDDDAEVAEAQEEMAREKIDEAQLKLARGAVDADANLRRELVEALSYINTVDTRAWFLYLSHDNDAKVRLAVATRIASSEHAEFKNRLTELADGDSDEQVRRQARVAIESRKDR